MSIHGDIPAFPCPGNETVNPEQTGMFLRDWFAGQALAGLRARDLMGAGENSRACNMHHNYADVCRLGAASQFLARLAYDDADAMMAERAKRDSP